MRSADRSRHVLMIEPEAAPMAPIVDGLTLRAALLLRSATPDLRRIAQGWHDCTGRGCPARSGNVDLILPDGRITNSLLAHYVACHRAECSPEDLALIDRLPAPPPGFAPPSAEELICAWPGDPRAAGLAAGLFGMTRPLTAGRWS